ncbi:ataxin-10 isoform X2 [Prorops nasuta]
MDLHLLSQLKFDSSENNWSHMIEYLKPNLFIDAPKEYNTFMIIAKVSEILVSNYDIPENVQVLLLKCLGNSCYKGFTYIKCNISSSKDKYNRELYLKLSEFSTELSLKKEGYLGQKGSFFPYGGVATWASDHILLYKNLENIDCKTEHNLVRLNIQFLSNLIAFAFDDIKFFSEFNAPSFLKESALKEAIITFIDSNQTSLAKASCVFIHNALKRLPSNYINYDERLNFCVPLFKLIKLGQTAAKDTLLILMYQSIDLHNIYDKLSSENKLYTLEIIFSEVNDCIYKNEKSQLNRLISRHMVEFLCIKFCEKCDTILKTYNLYLNDMEPVEIIILLDILGLISSDEHEQSNYIQTNKSLLINTVYLLKSLHTIGKQSSNFFTPVQKLSDIVSVTKAYHLNKNIHCNNDSYQTDLQKYNDFENHPGFGFKAALMRLIGNLSYKNEFAQNLL